MYESKPSNCYTIRPGSGIIQFVHSFQWAGPHEENVLYAESQVVTMVKIGKVVYR